MKQQRKIEDEREARRSLAAAEAAGGTIKQWARANGVDGRSLNAWRMNLERRGKKAVQKEERRGAVARRRASGRRPASPRLSRPAPSAGELGAMLVELVPASRPASEARYAVFFGEARVEVGDDFDPRTLRRLLEVLRAC